MLVLFHTYDLSLVTIMGCPLKCNRCCFLVGHFCFSNFTEVVVLPSIINVILPNEEFIFWSSVFNTNIIKHIPMLFFPFNELIYSFLHLLFNWIVVLDQKPLDIVSCFSFSNFKSIYLLVESGAYKFLCYFQRSWWV